MKLEKLLYFNEEISKDRMVASAISDFGIYYFYRDGYRNLKGEFVSGQMEHALEKTRKKKAFWRESSSKTTYFYSNEFDAIVVANFNKLPRSDSQNYIDLALVNCANHAINAFNAAHDSLTELLNRHSLEQRIQQIITAPGAGGTPGDTPELADQHQIAILTVDIDYFKQINDTYGHLYGDIVLKVFAHRLERLAERLAEDPQYKGRAAFTVSRPGGEEFTIMEHGTLSDAEVCRIAEQFKDEIGKQELPTKEEWAAYEETGLTTGLQFPPDRERKITCSIGLVTKGLPLTTGNIQQHMTTILNRADLALYKSKSSGRNKVCFFPDIVKRYGRVLEVHNETGVVVIDLGSDVGLKHGQELLVFHPQFDGSTDYVHMNGQTAKRLGQYPRLYTARIEAFDVQKEVSFCRILEKTPPNAQLVENSWLEAVPLGAINHLVQHSAAGTPMQSKAGAGPGTIEAIRAKIGEYAQEGPFCAVFRIAHEKDVIDNLGPASVNRILADLYNSLLTRFSWTATVGYIKPTQFAMVLHPSDAYNHVDQLTDALHEINEPYHGKVRVICGIYAPELVKKDYWVNKKIDHAAALELANVASLVPEISTEKPACTFDRNFLDVIVNIGLDKHRGTEQAIEDLKTLTAAGINDVWIYNQIGRYAFSLRDYDLALDMLGKALALDKSATTLKANMAIVYYRKEMYPEAFNTYRTIPEKEHEYIPKDYFGALAVCAYYASLDGGPAGIGDVKYLLDIALNNGNNENFVNEDVLAGLKQKMDTLMRDEQKS